MPLIAVLCKSLVRRDEHASLGLSKPPKLVIEDSLSRSAANVSYVMARSAKCIGGDGRDVLVHEDFHLVSTKSSSGVTCSSASEAA